MTFKKGGPCYRFHPVWTKEMDGVLMSRIGERSCNSIARAMGKSVEAVRKRAKRLGHRIDQESTTLRELSRQTGYGGHQLRRAARKLGQVWKRATTRKLLITGEEAGALVDYLANEGTEDGKKGRGEKHKTKIEKAEGVKIEKAEGVKRRPSPAPAAHLAR